MKISGIKQQVKRADRYSIYIDEKYVCSFSENELLNLGLRIGQELTPEGLDDLKRDAIRDKAYYRAIDLISRRLRSEWEIRDYLKRKEYEPDIIDLTVERLRERRYVDDRQFAQRWVDNRRLLKPISKRRLIQELQQKRVDRIAIDELFAEDETDEREALRSLIDKKRGRYPDRLKFMQYLARQGFGYDDIKTVLDEEQD